MPSPWVQRALANKLPPKSLDRFNGPGATLRGNLRSELPITADERTASAVHDSYASGPAGDPADAAGTVRALRAFGIVR